MKATISLIVAVVLLSAGCAPSRYVKPLAKNEQVISASLGGPVIRFAGAPVPMPFTTAGYARGLHERITAYVHAHITSALFGNLQTDAGLTIGLTPVGNKFGISFSPSVQQAYSLRSRSGFRIWPAADLNAYYHFGNRKSYAYAGAGSWFETSAVRAHNEPRQRAALAALQAGYQFAAQSWRHQLELKYAGPGIKNLPGVVDYRGIAGRGAIGIYYSVSYLLK